MVSKLLLLLATLAVLQHSIIAFDPSKDLEKMDVDVKAQIKTVTEKAADQDPNVLTEQATIAQIIGDHIENFDNDFGAQLKTLMQTIEAERQKAGINSPKALCLKLQETKLEPARAEGQNRAKGIQADVDTRTNDLVENTREMMEQIKLDLQVKTIVQLCMKLHPGIESNDDHERIKCFDQYGSDLDFAQKSLGETLLERVAIIQQAGMQISNKAKLRLQDMYVQNNKVYTDLDTTVKQDCLKL